MELWEQYFENKRSSIKPKTIEKYGHLAMCSQSASTYIREAATDSENTPITSPEVSVVANHLIRQRIWDDPCLTQRLQEALDELRFRGLME
jgi:hypothetical protein